MNPDIYPDPERWNPGRYLPDRAEDKKAPLSYVGWGTGRHPCLGMRFAKLEVGIIAAMFTAAFDFELVDDKGKKVDTAPSPNRNYFAASKPDEEVRIRYTMRQQ
ncbi:cytochrome P450 6A1 [Niveomyces insectorum RCEF 264]|uniref:Cytochrome P450 6A1 n=1 Tax=Niveomyces insectorum RCEF 264 TaxID=1081102 RepID=A0A167PCN4_9HYPO|nr:cytochrome P450 6A1 [Niveomyces insectorum RCEF 264]